MDAYCYLNGEVMPVSEAKVGVYDIGLLRGFGVYDGIAVYDGKPFRFGDHMRRFRRSAEALRLVVPATDEEIRGAIDELLQKNGLHKAVVRVLLTGGRTVNGIEFDPASPTFYILVEPFSTLPEALYESGGQLVTLEHRRFMPEAKTVNYITGVLAQEERKAKGAIEVLYVSDGMVLEAATSNFFAVFGETLVTPKENVLGGITRQVVMEIAEPYFKAAERDLPLEEALRADEAFITSSFKEIVPIVRIDGKTIGAGRPGPVTAKLMAAFQDYVESL